MDTMRPLCELERRKSESLSVILCRANVSPGWLDPVELSKPSRTG